MVAAGDEGCLKAAVPGNAPTDGATVRRPVTTPPPPPVDERQARQLLLLRAFEDGPEDGQSNDPLWTPEDRDWATRVARASLGANADPAAVVLERAAHAAQRLRGRAAALGRFLDNRFGTTRALLLALLGGAMAGLLVDQIGPSQRINLLAAPLLGQLLWNAVVYLALGWQALRAAGAQGKAHRINATPRGLRGWLARRWQPALPGATAGPRQRLAADWARSAAPLNGARAALLLHAASAALAAGVVAGGYARGLVLDYRAGWQSTFLEPATVHALLSALLAPASALTGVAVPGVDALAALRVMPDQAPQAPAAPWLHLFAATLALFVIGPRVALAAWAGARGAWLQRHWPLPWGDGYFQALLQAADGRPPVAWLLPHAAAPNAAQALALQARLVAACGPGSVLRVADPVGLAQEDEAARCTPPPDATVVLVAVDLASTPEDEAHGRLLRTVAAAAPARRVLLLADTAAFMARFGGLPQRLAERQQAWQQLAARHGVALLAVNLNDPPSADDRRIWPALLGASAAPHPATR